MSIPGWLVQDRAQACGRCAEKAGCAQSLRILQDDPECPRGTLLSRLHAIAARAWPEGVDRLSGCCDPVLVKEGMGR
jgi:hypothetical protein